MPAAIVNERVGADRASYADLEAAVRRLGPKFRQDDADYVGLAAAPRPKLLEHYLRFLDAETKRLHEIRTAARMAIIYARNHPGILRRNRKPSPSVCSSDSDASSYYSCADDDSSKPA